MDYDNIDNMDKELAKKIKESPFFKDLQEYIYSKVYELNSVKGLENRSNLEAGETVRARALAIDMLESILYPFINLKEKKEPTEEEITKREKDFGL